MYFWYESNVMQGIGVALENMEQGRLIDIDNINKTEKREKRGHTSTKNII